jgi:hypothetical protein
MSRQADEIYPKIRDMKANISLLLITLAVICFVLLPNAQAVVPAPDGGYPNFTTAEGQNALFSLTAGAANTAIGWYSLYSVGDANYNTGVGAGTLALDTADSNTAVGTAALLLNTTGDENVAVGTAALVYNESGRDNAAVGAFALYNNNGSYNTALGADALFDNVTCTDNTAVGDAALSFNDVTGAGLANNNTAVGSVALTFNTDGNRNTAVGAVSMFDNTTGSANTATGFQTLHNNTDGNNNTAIGHEALNHSTGNANTALGSNAGGGVTIANNVICIGANVAGENVSDSCFIGNIYSNVQPIVGTDPDSVTINSNGRLGRGNVSSRRYKHDIKPIDKASEVLYTLKPVSFRYNKEYDATQTLAFGLIAEEVAEVYPDLVGRNSEGKPESVRYEQINAMLLNEFLKEHRKVQELEASVAQQHKDFEAAVAELKGQIQKVSAQLELSKAEPQTVLNNQ